MSSRSCWHRETPKPYWPVVFLQHRVCAVNPRVENDCVDLDPMIFGDVQLTNQVPTIRFKVYLPYKGEVI
jgi:hypothetical protein